MAIETLYANTLVSGAIGTPANAYGAVDNVFTTDVDNTSWTARFSMENPVGNQANGTHTVTLRVRKESGTGTPTVNTVHIYENGVLRVSKSVAASITSLTGQDVVVSLTQAEIRLVTNLLLMEVEIVATSSGGGPSARSTVQLDAITWSGDFTTFVPTTYFGALTMPITFSANVVPAIPTSTSVARISLASGLTPITRTLHAIKVRARVTGGVGTLRVALYEGATNRSGDLETSALTGILADYSLPISDANAANITNYSDLEFRFWGYSYAGDPITVEIDQLWLEIPEGVAGPETHYGISSMLLSFGKEISASRKTFSQILVPLTFGKEVSGIRKVYGQLTLPIIFSKEIIAQRKTFGQLLSPFIFGKSVAGTKQTFGQTAFPITVGISTAGYRPGVTHYGIFSLPVIFGKEISGRRQAYGQIAFPLTFAKEISARRTTFGQIELPIIFTKEAVGQRDVFGQLSMSTLFGKETVGIRKTFGQISLPIIFGKEISAYKQTFGQIDLPIDFTAFVDGIGFIGPKTLYGEVSFPIIFGKNISAQRETFGQITAPYIFGSLSQGRRTSFGVIDLSLDMLIDVDSGSVGVFGQVSLPMIFAIDTNGILRPIATILNLAETIYLGSTPVVAVYTENQQVWP